MEALNNILDKAVATPSAKELVRQLLTNLDDRRGFHLDNLDDDVMLELVQSWLGIVEAWREES
jgi:hypothetical protein